MNKYLRTPYVKKHFPFPTNIRIFVCFAPQSLMNELIYL